MISQGRPRRLLAQVQLALMLLTRLPAGRLPDPAPRLAEAAWAFPLAGLAVGALGALGLMAGLAVGLPAAVAAGLAVAVQVLVTGALHEDGLADCADGIWGGREVARRLEIMRDSRIGSYGVLALVLGVGLRWQALAAVATLSPGLAGTGLIALAMSSRVASVALMAALPPARADGMGHRATGATWASVALAAGLAIGAHLGLGLGGVAPLLAQAVTTVAVAALAQRKLHGQTGDVLGAAQQLAEIGGWLALLAALG